MILGQYPYNRFYADLELGICLIYGLGSHLEAIVFVLSALGDAAWHQGSKQQFKKQ
jgi:hypothetical protein